MITRSFDYKGLNEVVNHPQVFPWVTLPGTLKVELEPVIRDQRNILLKATDGFFLGTYENSGVYEVHTQFYPWAKTKQSIQDGQEAIQWMKKVARSLVTRVPAHNIAADWFARRSGFKHWFTNKLVWPTKDGPVDLKFYRLELCPSV